jgi:hypothetical protein
VCGPEQPCEAGAVCVSIAEGAARCLDRCPEPGDATYCRSGQACRALRDRSYGFCL